MKLSTVGDQSFHTHPVLDDASPMLQSFQSDVSNKSLNYNDELYQTSFDHFCDLMDKDPKHNITPALIQGLGFCIQNSESKTSGGFLQELQNAIDFFTRKSMTSEAKRFKSRLTLKALCAIYTKMVKKELGRIGHQGNFEKIKENIQIRTERMTNYSVNCHEKINKYASNVLRDGMTIMVHSTSKSVQGVLQSAADRGIKIKVITTECQPQKFGQDVQNFCQGIGIPCNMILDSSIGFCMNSVDCVFVGAEAVLENGGIVNRIGTLTIAMCAKAYNKPFYVFVESLKFLKRFPLQQSDIFAILDEDHKTVGMPEGSLSLISKQTTDGQRVDITNVLVDYTAPEYISELFTDLGIFTPAAVSDELIKYFQ